MTGFANDIKDGLTEAFNMFWATLWALVVGFVLAGAVQAFVRRDEMRKALGDHGAKSIGKATFFGIVSSSCSYASSALARSLFLRGADFTASMVFMIASTNLVLELGIVLWLLMGWQFAAAEFVGGFIMIGLLALLMPRVLPEEALAAARTNDDSSDNGGGHTAHSHEGHQHHHTEHEHEHEVSGHEVTEHPAQAWRERLRDRQSWRAAFGYTLGDLTMIRKELVIGFLVAGFLGALVPMDFWQSLFLTQHGFVGEIENALLGPLLAIISFVCSVGNVPLAAALWHGGISFAGVVSFIFADLITLPLLLIYRRYFGTAITLRILTTFWLTMSTGGLAVSYLFKAVRIHAPARELHQMTDGVRLNYTSVLNVLALVSFAALYVLYRRNSTESTHTEGPASRYATDPICGMQVEKALAPATRTVDGVQYWFCSPHCAQRFAAERPAPASSTGPQLIQLGLAVPTKPDASDPDASDHGAEPGSCCH